QRARRSRQNRTAVLPSARSHHDSSSLPKADAQRRRPRQTADESPAASEREGVSMASLGQITHLRAYSREPFRELLDQWLANGPTDEQIQKIAAKTPDRWTQGLPVIGRLPGHTAHT